nr:hypothetical protein [Tanacetum cinerariifolium]
MLKSFKPGAGKTWAEREAEAKAETKRIKLALLSGDWKAAGLTGPPASASVYELTVECYCDDIPDNQTCPHCLDTGRPLAPSTNGALPLCAAASPSPAPNAVARKPTCATTARSTWPPAGANRLKYARCARAPLPPQRLQSPPPHESYFPHSALRHAHHAGL